MGVRSKKCKNCKKPFKPTYSSLQQVCGHKCAAILAREKESNKAFKEMKIKAHEKDYKKTFQDEINKLSRLIDAKFYNTCIDCGNIFTGQIDAAHYHARGSNCTLRYNLHNLHAARGYCNQHSPDHKAGYAIGLGKRYGKEYADYVVKELPLKYKEIHLTAHEIVDKLKIVRKLIREFNTFDFTDAKSARTLLNNILGIYE